MPAKNTLWTSEHAAEAAAEGWGVFWVFEHGPRGRLQILPTSGGSFNKNYPSADALYKVLVQQARNGKPLYIAALRYITQGNK